MLSVLKNTKTPVKFWFLKNYLSPTFKVGFLRFSFGNGLFFSQSLCEGSILRTHSSASLWFPNSKKNIFLDSQIHKNRNIPLILPFLSQQE